MKRISVLMVVMGLVFVFVGCGRISPTGPSEAVASNTAKSSAGTGTTTTATTPVLSFSPSQTIINVGDEVTVEAVVGNAVDLWGIAATVLLDSSKLQFVRADEERLIAAQNPTSFMYSNRSDPNKLVLGLSSLGNVQGVTGYGTLFRMTFKAISSGQSELKFIETTLFNSVNEGVSKQKINSEFQSATITIR